MNPGMADLTRYHLTATYHLDREGRVWTFANGFHWRPATAEEMLGYVLGRASLARSRT